MPTIDNSKKRVTGPFTLESVPSQRVRSISDVDKQTSEADKSISRSGQTSKQNDWMNELEHTGIRAKGGKILEFSRIESHPGTRWLHAEAETKEDNPKKAIKIYKSFFDYFVCFVVNNIMNIMGSPIKGFVK